VRLDENDPEKGVFDSSASDPFGTLRNASGASLSGLERNNVFLNRGGERFDDVSGLSGFDDPADGRALALLDYDRDGWLDMAVANANAPALQLFRNQVGEIPHPRPERRTMLALRLVGGNHTAEPAEGLSARDGYGARVTLAVGGATLLREHRAGEGFAAQNSAVLRIGLGDVDSVDRLRVDWPSGRVQELGPVAAGSLVTVYEDASQSPDGTGFAIAAYRVPGVAERVAARLRRPTESERNLAFADGNAAGAAPRLRLVTTMATWCPSCKAELPQVARLREAFGSGDLEILAVPIDEDDSRQKLEDYEREYKPAYDLRKDLTPEQIGSVKQIVLDDLRIDALPAAILTDGRGRVIRTLGRLPSISEIRALLAASGGALPGHGPALSRSDASSEL
jgi:thiol-disulfide isomerase/thioredoxin